MSWSPIPIDPRRGYHSTSVDVDEDGDRWVREISFDLRSLAEFSAKYEASKGPEPDNWEVSEWSRKPGKNVFGNYVWVRVRQLACGCKWNDYLMEIQ